MLTGSCAATLGPVGQLPAAVGVDQRARLHQAADQLGDEERVAVGAGLERAASRSSARPRGALGDPAQQLDHVARSQPGQVQPQHVRLAMESASSSRSGWSSASSSTRQVATSITSRRSAAR